VIREDLNLVRSSLAVTPPVLEGIDDCQEHLVVDFVVDFRWLKLPGVEGHRV